MKLKNKLRSMQEETYTEGRFQRAACAAGTAPQGTVVTGTGALPGGGWGGNERTRFRARFLDKRPGERAPSLPRKGPAFENHCAKPMHFSEVS